MEKFWSFIAFVIYLALSVYGIMLVSRFVCAIERIADKVSQIADKTETKV